MSVERKKISFIASHISLATLLRVSSFHLKKRRKMEGVVNTSGMFLFCYLADLNNGLRDQRRLWLFFLSMLGSFLFVFCLQIVE